MRQQTTKSKSHSCFWLLLTMLLGLVTIRYALQIDIPRALFLVPIVLICLLGNQDEIIAMCMCCIPLYESIDFFYALVSCVAIYVVRNYKRIRINLGVILILGMIVWELLHCFILDFSIRNFICSIVPLIVLAVMMCSDLSELDYVFVVRALAIATLGVCISLFLKVLYLAGFNVTLAISGLQRLGMDTAEASEQVTVVGGQVNPNALGIIGVLAITGLMQLWLSGRGKKTDLLLVCAIMIICALTASRTYLVCLALMVLLFLFGQNGPLLRKIRFFGLVMLLLALALIMLHIFFPDLLAYYIGRFFEEDITTGRDDLMVVYHKFIVSNPKVLLFGIGLQDFGEQLTQLYRVARNVPHNSIQELIIVWGVPGIVLFICLILIMFSSANHFHKKQRLINLIPLCVLLVKGMAGQMLTSSYTMLAFSFAYLSMCCNVSKDETLRTL